MKGLYKSLIEVLFLNKNCVLSTKETKNSRAEELVESGLIKLVNEEKGRLFEMSGQITRHYQPTKKGKKLINDVYAVFEKYLK